MKVAAAAAGHHSTTVASSNPNRELQNRGQNSDAIRLVEHTLWHEIRGDQYSLHDLSCVFDTVGFFVLRQKWKCQGESRDKTEQSLFHSSSSGSFSGGGILRERYYAREAKSSRIRFHCGLTVRQNFRLEFRFFSHICCQTSSPPNDEGLKLSQPPYCFVIQPVVLRAWRALMGR